MQHAGISSLDACEWLAARGPCDPSLDRLIQRTADICRYPPVIDPKMEEAAEALQAIMQDLAAQQPQPAALPPPEQPPAADPEAEGEAEAAQDAMDTDGKPGDTLGSCAAENVVAIAGAGGEVSL